MQVPFQLNLNTRKKPLILSLDSLKLREWRITAQQMASFALAFIIDGVHFIMAGVLPFKSSGLCCPENFGCGAYIDSITEVWTSLWKKSCINCIVLMVICLL